MLALLGAKSIEDLRLNAARMMLALQAKGRRWNFILIMVVRWEAFQKERDRSYV